MAEENEIREYVAATRKHFATYHDHKEKMAYAATALYLTGVSVLIFQKEPGWIKAMSCAYSTLAVVVFAGLALSFICWQLLKKYHAGTIVSACDSLRVAWLKECPATLDMSKTRYGLVEVPKFLHAAIEGVKNPWSILWSSVVAILVVVVWAAMLYWRVESLVCRHV